MEKIGQINPKSDRKITVFYRLIINNLVITVLTDNVLAICFQVQNNLSRFFLFNSF